MKKIIIPALSLLVLSGCSSTNETTFVTSITDGDETAVTVNDEIVVTNDDIYHYMLETQGASTIVTEALTYIGDLEITDEEAIDAKVQEQIEEYESYTESSIEDYAIEQGYESKDEYVNDIIIPSVKNSLLIEKYVDENYDTLVTDYQVKYLKTVTFDTESEAVALIDQSTDTETFDTLFAENSGVDVGFVTNESTSIDANIIAKFDELTNDGIYSKAIMTSTGQYVVVYVYNSDLEAVKDEVITNITSLSSISLKTNAYYLDKYEFSIYENEIKEQIESSTPEYIG